VFVTDGRIARLTAVVSGSSPCPVFYQGKGGPTTSSSSQTAVAKASGGAPRKSKGPQSAADMLAARTNGLGTSPSASPDARMPPLRRLLLRTTQDPLRDQTAGLAPPCHRWRFRRPSRSERCAWRPFSS
jgi:hypothetical protein